MGIRKKIGGGKLSRSETISVRLDPKLRCAAELAARKQRRTLSSFIEWAVEEAVDGLIIYSNENVTFSAADAAQQVWDVDEADRFARLALHFPMFLTHDEERLWKIICENGYFWRGKYDEKRKWQWNIREDRLVFEYLRSEWELLKQIVAGLAEKSSFPQTPDDVSLPDGVPF